MNFIQLIQHIKKLKNKQEATKMLAKAVLGWLKPKRKSLLADGLDLSVWTKKEPEKPSKSWLKK